MKTWRFSALDSLFFREARPFDNLGGSELSTVFPPPVGTLAGAIRVAIGNHKNINWADYADSDLAKQLGNGDSLGNLRIKGVFLSFKQQRLYPVPAHLVATQEKGKLKTLHFLQVGKPAQCDLGKAVQLAVAPKDKKNETIKGVKPLENYWLTQTGFENVLKGELPLLDFDKKHPEKGDLIPASCLFERETHLGIGRDNQTRAAKQGLLYQTQHIRPKLDLAIDVDIDGLDNIKHPESGIVRLGGEGRGAAFTVEKTNNTLPACDNYQNAQGIKLILLSAVYVEQKNGYTPLPNFEKHEHCDETVWQGEINAVKLTLHCAIIGKTVREGGWDLQKREPKPVRSFIPAGSVFYCKVDDVDIKTAIENLDGKQINSNNTSDLDQHLGRGLIAVCPWFKQDNFQEQIK